MLFTLVSVFDPVPLVAHPLARGRFRNQYAFGSMSTTSETVFKIVNYCTCILKAMMALKKRFIVTVIVLIVYKSGLQLTNTSKMPVPVYESTLFQFSG